MRKYFSPRSVRKCDATTRLPKQIDVWLLLRSFVQGSAGFYSWDILCDLLSACRERSVSRYLEVGARLDAQSRLYTGSEDVEQVFVHRQTIAFLKKFAFPDSDLPTSPRDAAIKKWTESEERCRDTNERLGTIASTELPSWVHRARRVIADVLGELEPSLVMKMINDGKHGPGTTRSNHGNRLSAYYKYADFPYTVTRRAAPYAFAAISSDPKWLDVLESSGLRKALPPVPGSSVQRELQIITQCVEFEDSDKITFVPKNCRVDRSVAAGASLNIFMQLGVKAYMQEGLAKYHVTLDDQSHNQALAKLGAIHYKVNGCDNCRQFSTIDLESASDTISIGIVKLLLPAEWFAFLSDLRHESGQLGSETMKYAKFSAMGNGFTFPLESLIFFGICKGVHEVNGWSMSRNDFAVYGDDIIVRQLAASACISALEWSGFSVNKEKTFLSGPFKESCGEDYFTQHNVRPYYLKSALRTYEDIYKMCNWINFKYMRCSFARCLIPLYTLLVSFIPKDARAYGPLVEGATTYFATSLSDLNAGGIRPFLSSKERRALAQSGLLSWDMVDYQSPLYICTVHTAKPYRAQWRVQYMLWLRYQSLAAIDKNPWCKDNVMREAIVMGNTTSRRNSIESVVRVLPVLNWNGQAQYLNTHRSLGTIAIE